MLLYEIFQKHPQITTDSRNCPEGSIFFALKGENFDANAFAADALKRGCAFAVIDNKDFAVDERYIVVDDCLKTLQDLARFHRNELGTKVIGITGTNGKTTTKELIASVLKEKFNILYTRGNLNNHIGVPLTLLQLKPEHELAVVEMGANHPGEIEFLCGISLPDYGIITNVGKAHLEGFGSFEGVKRTKAELYSSIAGSGNAVFINSGNPELMQMASDTGLSADQFIYYAVSESELKDTITGYACSENAFLSMIIRESDTENQINTRLIGNYNAENVLAAYTIGRHFDIPQDLIQSGLENYQPDNNRSQLTKTERNTLIVDAYNANPTSMRAALINFAQIKADNKVLILGDMRELGEQSIMEHQNILNLLTELQFENVYLVGEVFKSLKPAFDSFSNKEELMEKLSTEAIHDSLILIKGSRGIQLEKTLNLL